MRLDKLTIKSQEALQHAQALAEKRNHQAIDVEHLLMALLGQKEGVVLSLLQKLGIPVPSLFDRLQRILDRFPQVTGGATGQTFITPRLKKAIEGAEAAIGDEHDFPGRRGPYLPQGSPDAGSISLGPYSLQPGDLALAFDPGGGARNVDLPAEQSCTGVVIMISNKADAAEIICDGHHVHPTAVRVAVAVGVLVRVGVAVAGTGVLVAVAVAVSVGGTGVSVAVAVGVEVMVGIAVAVGVAVAVGASSVSARS